MNEEQIETNIVDEAVKKIAKPRISKSQKSKAHKNQIILLNDIVKVKIAPSEIHGVGLIAIVDIKKGEKLYTDIIPHQLDLPYSYFSFLRSEVRDIILGQFPLIVDGSHFMYPAGKLSAYLNHSDTPNYDSKKDEALRDIKKGEEITEDYKLITPRYKKVYTWLK